MAELKLKSTPKIKKIDYLTEDDPITHPYKQLWTCISFLSPEGIKNCTIRGLKIRGVYDTYERAQERAKALQNEDPDFHVFVGEMGKWLPWDPNPDSAEDQEYAESELNDLMKAYKQNQEKAKLMEKERKNEMLRESLAEETQKKDKREEIRERLRKKLDNKKMQKMQDLLEPSDLTNGGNCIVDESKYSHIKQSLATENAAINNKIESTKTMDSKIEETQQTIQSMDSQLAKMKELYESIQKKRANPIATPIASP